MNINIDDLLKLTKNIIREARFDIFCHPDNLKLLKDICKQDFGQPLMYVTLGIEIKTDSHIPKFKQKWVFPKDRFVEYEEKDKIWAIPLKIGHWEDTDEPLFMQIRRESFNFLRPIAMKYE
jgi:hypothetical protein